MSLQVTNAEIDEMYHTLLRFADRVQEAGKQIGGSAENSFAYYATQAAQDSITAAISSINAMKFSGKFPQFSFEAYYTPTRRK
jgi:hypothetical protein